MSRAGKAAQRALSMRNAFAIHPTRPMPFLFLLAMLAMLSTHAHASLFASNCSFGSTIYVLAEAGNGTLGYGSVSVSSPSGKSYGLELFRGQAKINASEPGEWKFLWGNETASALVYDELPAPEGQAAAEPPFLLVLGAVFLIAIAGIALFMNSLRTGAPSFSKTGPGGSATAVFTCGATGLDEVRIFSSESGRLLMKKEKIRPAEKISVSWEMSRGERGKPALAVVRHHGEEERVLSNGADPENKTKNETQGKIHATFSLQKKSEPGALRKLRRA